LNKQNKAKRQAPINWLDLPSCWKTPFIKGESCWNMSSRNMWSCKPGKRNNR
jgi:hypothetical protein